MFDQHHSNKIKNDKIYRWRLELSCYSYDIIYRPGKLNTAADALSRANCSASDLNSLSNIHNMLCHPGITRMIHFVRTKNLPFSVDDVKRITDACNVCKECKPQFYKPKKTHLIKAMHPFERLSIDFKGPLPSSTRNKYFLTVIDEYSRFPFVFPCSDLTSKTVIKCLQQLFTIFGLPNYIHSDRGSSFMSSELKDFLLRLGVCSSHTTPYNPQGNGQCERYNGVIWNTITLALKSKQKPLSMWESVLPDVLHSMRSLLCTATNSTPHERLFNFERGSVTGNSIPSWLATPGPVLMKRHIRASKFQPVVDRVDLLECHPNYARVRLSDGKITTVSLRDLAPCGTPIASSSDSSLDINSVNDPNNVKESTGTQRWDSNKGTHRMSENDSFCNDSVNEMIDQTSEIVQQPCQELTPITNIVPVTRSENETNNECSPFQENFANPNSPRLPTLRRSGRIRHQPNRLDL